MWSYYGSKTNLAAHYPKPLQNLIIEPFAGAAKYSLANFEKDVLLVDKYSVIIDIWKWLQSCSPKDILSLPVILPGHNLNDFQWDCVEQKLLMGFIIQYGVARPALTPSKTKLEHRKNYMNFTKQNIAENLFKIKHWKFECKNYLDISNIKATWFIDPPYQYGGDKYVMSNKKIDFEQLSTYCKGRKGQTIVCENQKANWLPFVPFVRQHGSKGFQDEVIWTNYHTHYSNIQQKLIL